MPLLDGLTLAEWVLLIAGCALFIVLLILLLQAALHNKSYKALLPFFGFPVVMIGFSAIKSIEIGKDTVTIERDTASLQENPADAASRASLKETLNNLDGRTFHNPDTLTKIAEAHFALGNQSAAQRSLEQALKVDPKQPNALQLQRRIEIANQLTSLTEAAEKQPSDPEVKQQLQHTVSEARQYKFANPAAVQAMQKANTLLRPDLTAQQKMKP